MSFEEVRVREMVLSRAASITMVSRNGCPAYALVSLASPVGRDLTGWVTGGKAALQIGKGEDTGKIRIAAKPEGLCTLRAMRHPSTWQIVLGHHSIFGTEPRKASYTAARVIDRNTVEIDLPAWGGSTAREEGPELAAKAVQASKEWADEARVAASRTRAPARLPEASRLPSVPLVEPEPDHRAALRAELAKRRAELDAKQASGGSVPHPPVAPAAPAQPRRHTEREGVTISPAPHAHIGHAHRGGISLTETQALFLEPLVIALGSLIPTAVIMQRTRLRADEITWALCDLQSALKCIGLRLEHHKPFYILKKE